MKKEIIVTDDFLNSCMNCGCRFDAKGVYDFYCSQKCEQEDRERITRMINEGKHPTEIMADTMRKATS